MKSRFALQFGQGRFWRNVKVYDAEKIDLRFVSDVMFRLACQHGAKHFRILLMPINLLLETTEPSPALSRYLHEIHTQP